jgi:cytochrome c biogenesis protein CcmG/thiol:disulfide interchange protein DsbE
MTPTGELAPARQWLIVAGTIALIFGGLASVAAFWPPPPPVSVGARAPSFHASRVSGPLRGESLEAFRGSVVVLNIWSTTCIPCLKEMPSLERLSRQFADSGVHVVGISVDERGTTTASIAEFARQRGVTFGILHDRAGAVMSAYQVNGLPTTVVIDATGVIAFRESGGVDWSDSFHVARVQAALHESSAK